MLNACIKSALSQQGTRGGLTNLHSAHWILGVVEMVESLLHSESPNVDANPECDNKVQQVSLLFHCTGSNHLIKERGCMDFVCDHEYKT